MSKKITKREHFETLLTYAEVQANPDMVEFIKHEMELLARKNSADKKPTAAQQANKELMDGILSCMEENKLYQCSDMIKTFPCCAGLSTPKVSGVLRLMYNSATPTVERIEDKKKTYFRKIID